MLQALATDWLATLALAQTDNGLLDRVPLWLIVLIVLLVIVFAVVWTLHEEGEGKDEAVSPTPEPISETETRAMPVVETAVVPIPDAEMPSTPVMETAIEPVPVQPDDLKKIEGIGPKIASLLQAKGIATFAQLAATEVANLREIMLEAKLRIANPDTWPEQAALAAAGDWDALATLQDNLKGGRRTKE